MSRMHRPRKDIMSITDSYGFRSAQNAWENASPYDNECDCPPLFRCPNCEEFSTENTECTKCDQELGGYPEPSEMQEVERDESTEGVLTESSCNLHNHTCKDRYCCD